MFPLSVEQIAKALVPPDLGGFQMKPSDQLVTNLGACWPLLRSSLKAQDLFSTPAAIAALATIRVECPGFHPETEKYNGNPIDYFENKYGGRADLGNTSSGDGYKYRGRGLIQITGKANYSHFGRAIAVDLVNNPDRALELPIAVDILVAFFAEKGIAELAERGRWESVRQRVNGGLNGYPEFLEYVRGLEAAAAAAGAVPKPALSLPKGPEPRIPGEKPQT
jgi:hypothetical protein